MLLMYSNIGEGMTQCMCKFTKNDISVISVLKVKGSLAMRDILKVCYINDRTILCVLRRLLLRGLVKKSKSFSDMRLVIYSLTEDGIKIADGIV